MKSLQAVWHVGRVQVLALAASFALATNVPAQEWRAKDTGRSAVASRESAPVVTTTPRATATTTSPSNPVSRSYQATEPARLPADVVSTRAISPAVATAPVVSTVARPVELSRPVPSPARHQSPTSATSAPAAASRPNRPASLPREPDQVFDPRPSRVMRDPRVVRASGQYPADWQHPPRAFRADRLAGYLQPAVKPFKEDAIESSPSDTRSGESVPTPSPMPGLEVMENELPAAEMVEGDVIYEGGEFDDGGMVYDGFGGCGPDGLCIDASLPDPMRFERFHICGPFSFLNEAALFAGAQGFKGPLDQGGVGNFGFHEGLGISDVFWHRHGIGYQIGASYNQSNFSGIQGNGVPSNTRRQTYVTAGLFHRAFYNRGWQFGVVMDYLSENYYVNTNVVQVRSEISYLTYCGHEFGFWATGATRKSAATINLAPATLAPIDMYNFFYRMNLSNGGQARIWGGFTSPVFGGAAVAQADGVVGGDFRLPLCNKLDFNGGFNYLIPGQANQALVTREAWGLSMNVVWYPGRCRQGIHNGPYRALFGVADNNTLIVDRQP